MWSLRYIDSPVLRNKNTDDDGDCDDEWLYYTTDANQNVTALIDGDPQSQTFRNVLERYNYDPYGNVTIMDGSWGSRSTSSYDNHILFAGYYRDAETGLYHVRNRMYHPHVSWLQRDPLGYADGMSLYEYVASGPCGLTDPMGLMDTETFIDLASKCAKQRREAERCRREADNLDRAADKWEEMAQDAKDPEWKKECLDTAARLRDGAQDLREQGAGHEERAREIEQEARDLIERDRGGVPGGGGGGGKVVGGGGDDEKWDWSDWEHQVQFEEAVAEWKEGVARHERLREMESWEGTGLKSTAEGVIVPAAGAFVAMGVAPLLGSAAPAAEAKVLVAAQKALVNPLIGPALEFAVGVGEGYTPGPPPDPRNPVHGAGALVGQTLEDVTIPGAQAVWEEARSWGE